MRINTPLLAVGSCVAVGVAAIPTAIYYGTDKGSVAIAGVGALGQVVVAVLLYFLTRDQLQHARSEAAYRRIEQQIAKAERRFEEMNRTYAAFGNSKTGIGKKRCDEEQVARLDRLRDDMRTLFIQPVSQNFNKMVDAAKAAAKIGVDQIGYHEKIVTFETNEQLVYVEITRQLESLRAEIRSSEHKLENQ